MRTDLTLLGRPKEHQNKLYIMGSKSTYLDESDSAEFRYAKLPGPRYIRTITLLPTPDQDKLSCHLQAHSLDDDDVPYEALSYLWGHHGYAQTIVCNGRCLSISQNLYGFLDRLRVNKALTPARLWIDAICINQKDNEERSQQVMLMKHIYTQAQGVIIWLGADFDGDAHLAFNLASEITNLCCQLLHIHVSDVGRINVRQALDKVGHEIISDVNDDIAQWHAIQGLFKRWW